MTAKPPNTPILSPDAQSETTATVTFDQILDSSGIPVGKNSITFDSVLDLKGTAGANSALNIRDRFNVINNVTSGSTGSWTKKIDFQQGFKRYSLNAIERDPPQDFSSQYIFVLATETPIIDTVIGKDGQIENGDTYNGDSLEFSGYAPPNMEVEAFNGDTPTDQKVTVDDVGVFNLTLVGLTAGDYSIKIKAANDKESGVFAFKVVVDGALSLDEVADSKGLIPDGGTTFEDKVTVNGFARPGEEVQLLNDGALIDGATATAGVDGAWQIVIDVTPNTYRLTARAPSEVTDPAYTFIVAQDVELSLDDVKDSKGTIVNGGTTYEDKVTVSGYARPGEEVQLRNNNARIDGATATAQDDNGLWEIELDVTLDSYSLTVEALYGDGEISTQPRTFNVESIIRPRNTRVYDSDGLIADNGSTPYNFVIVRGDAAPSAQIKLQINDVTDSKPEPTDDKGRWVKLVQNLDNGITYKFIAIADYGDNAESNPWTITIEE
ncbi:carboxypeptidase regulatory-like domain-containing protein [Pseudomonas sp. GL-R-19]|uniref:carboxypeptidase regulatory-like domain-containing protein n=1 Tax=Pseudomonas sp. GL-R-19 TaxID=2832391 RepID=UPI001CBDCE64|nr:carboxypeptidase regulatory-like domain-containing protein [Pseudomonas sp. GL-R-19]